MIKNVGTVRDIMSLPKLSFQSCDETSLKLSWDRSQLEGASQGRRAKYFVQYKEPHEDWEKAAEYPVRSASSGEINLTEADIVDLKPGTPYFVRIKLVFEDDNSVLVGPETVFDTKPVDCTPSRKKKCIIS